MKQRSVMIHISGKVQGVYFRESTRNRAEHLNINGFVRNLDNGQVQIGATGTTDAIKELIAWCAVGPPAAHVENVEVAEMDLTPSLDFKVLR